MLKKFAIRNYYKGAFRYEVHSIVEVFRGILQFYPLFTTTPFLLFSYIHVHVFSLHEYPHREHLTNQLNNQTFIRSINLSILSMVISMQTILTIISSEFVISFLRRDKYALVARTNGSEYM